MQIKTFASGPVATNAYLVFSEEGSSAIVVDAPMDSADVVASSARKNGVEPEALILTHTHWDHTADAVKMKGLWPRMMVYVHPDDEYRLAEPMKHTIWPVPFQLDPLTPDVHLYHGQRLQLAGLTLEVRHTPGHTEGGVALYCAEEKAVFVGDTLFAGSVGRTDLPGGDWETLVASIWQQLLTLPDDTVVYPGHGPATTIGEERQSNPFLGA